MSSSIYFDHGATTALDPQVLSVYVEALALLGNPSSLHSHGQAAKRMLAEAKERLAAVLGCHPMEVVFTGGGTESINAALKGIWWHRQLPTARPDLLVAQGEHHATLDAAQWLSATQGASLRLLPVDPYARLLPSTLAAALTEQAATTALCSVMWANNEVGTVNPIAQLAQIAAEFRVPLHVDAVAALGYVPINLSDTPLSALSISAHKIGGPVGVAALILSRSQDAVPLLHGGSQQRARSGTADAPGALAFAVAAERAESTRLRCAADLAQLRNQLVQGVLQQIPDAQLRGAPTNDDRLPGNAHFTFPGCSGDSLLFLLDAEGVSVSTGSACQAGVAEVSHVLQSMGVPEMDARGALRLTLSYSSSAAEVDAVLAVLPTAVARARAAGVS